MNGPMKKIRAVLSLLVAAGTAVQCAPAAFADTFIDDGAGEIKVITPVIGESSEYGLQDVYYVDENGERIEFNLIPDEMDREYNAATIPSSYNLNALGKVSSVRDQGSTQSCWAHAALAAAESSIIMKGLSGRTIDLSESHLVWFSRGQNTSASDPLYGDPAVVPNCYDLGGSDPVALGALSSWMGAAAQSSYPDIESRPAIAESKRYDSIYHLRSSVTFAPSDRTAIKGYLMENGAMTLSYHADDDKTTVNHYKTTSSYTSFYQNEETKPNHAVTIVGWDDNFSKSNFVVTPPGNGAWLIKNSWGTSFGMNGYFYLSYYDPSIRDIYSYEMEKTGNYSKVYQHSMVPYSRISPNSGYITGANVFTASGSDPLAAVSFYTSEASVPYTIYIYSGVSSTNPMSGKLLLTQTGTATYAGYHTVDLSKTVSIPSGTKFSICVALRKDKTMLFGDTYAKSSGDSFFTVGIGTASSEWLDTYSACGCNIAIKAFAKASAPAKPAVKAAAGDSNVTLAWNAVPGASQYAVYRYLNGGYTKLTTTTGTSYTASGLTNGTKYGFLVRAGGSGGWSAFTSADVVYATPTSPVEKPKVTATAGDRQVTLTWNKIPGADLYIAYYFAPGGSLTSIGSGTYGTTKTATGLTNGVKYGFLVRARVNGTWTPFTSADYVYATPTAKPKVTATAGDRQVTLTWNKIPGADLYIAYYFAPGGSLTSIGGGTYDTKRTATGLTNGVKYGFLVRARVNGTWTPFTSADYVYATPTAKPKVTATAGDRQVTLTWNKIPGADLYIAYYFAPGGSLTSIGGGTYDTKRTATGLTNGVKYGFLVRARVNGTWTPFTSADYVYSTPLSAKPVLKAAAGSGKVSLSWTNPTGASKFAVYVYLNGNYSQQTVTSGTSYTVTGLTNGIRYGFLVRAYNNGAWNAFSTDDIVYAIPGN